MGNDASDYQWGCFHKYQTIIFCDMQSYSQGTIINTGLHNYTQKFIATEVTEWLMPIEFLTLVSTKHTREVYRFDFHYRYLSLPDLVCIWLVNDRRLMVKIWLFSTFFRTRLKQKTLMLLSASYRLLNDRQWYAV